MAKESNTSITRYLFHREYGFHRELIRCSKLKVKRSIVNLVNQMEILFEHKATSKAVIEKECRLRSEVVKTTFFAAFSSDGRRMATLHGDHTIRIIDISTGRNIQTLVGHPRSPWTVEFHKSFPNILASGCLGGQVRIWDLFSGDCDVWHSPTGSSITSITLHPTEQILLIAEANNLYTWHWQLCLEPQLFGSSRKHCERVRWVKFDNSGDIFYTGITTNAEYDSWNILRQAPSAFEMSQQRRETTARSRSQYQASLNATVSLGEMLGNPLEISNDLLAQPNSQNNSMDVYHVATTFAQLHRIHTGDSEEGDSSPFDSPNLSMSNYQSSGRSPRISTTRENQNGRFSTTQTWSPSSRRQGVFTSVSNSGGSIIRQLISSSSNDDAIVPSAGATNRVEESGTTAAVESPTTDTTSQTASMMFVIANATSQTTTATSESANPASGTRQANSQTVVSPRSLASTSRTTSIAPSADRSSGASGADDSIFGVSLRAGLSSSRPIAISQSRARHLATSRPSIRRLSNSLAVFEPNEAVEVAQQAEQAHLRNWSAVLKVLGRLEGVRGPRLYSSSIAGIAGRLEELVSEYQETTRVDSRTLRLLRQLCITIQPALTRSTHSEQPLPHHISARMMEVARRLQSIIIQPIRDRSGGPRRVGSDTHTAATTRADALPAGTSETPPLASAASTHSSSPSSVTDSSTNTEPTRTTRSFGVSTDDYDLPRNEGVAPPIVLIPEGNNSNRGTWMMEDEFYGNRSTLWNGGLRPINSVMVIRNGPHSSSILCCQRIQRWRLDDRVEHLNVRDNTIINRCRIHNDTSIDISQDGKMLAVLVKNPITAHCPGIYKGMLPDTMLRLISLEEDSLGAVLHQITLVANPVSLSISPLNGFVVVGLAGYRSNTEHSMIKYDVYKIPQEIGGRLKTARSVYSALPDYPMAIVNYVRWLPLPGQGMVIGTNHGNVIIKHNAGAARATLASDSRLLFGASRSLYGSSPPLL